MVDALVIACGEMVSPIFAELPVDLVRLPAVPAATDIDPLLAGLGSRRLIVNGDDGAFAAIVQRLLRCSRLPDVSVGLAPVGESEVAAVFGLPSHDEDAVRLALRGDPDPVPLIRDDAGGVLVGLGLLRQLGGVVYCDDELVLRGQASRLEVSPDPTAGPDTSAGGLTVRVWGRGLLRRRVREVSGRAVQIGCLPNQVICDGVPHPRPVQRWTWYRHTEDLRLIRGLL